MQALQEQIGLSADMKNHNNESVRIAVNETLEERAAEYDGKLMLDGEYDWGEPVGREVW